MSTNYIRVCSTIILELFGYATQKVADVLLRDGPQQLRSLVQKSSLPLSKVKDVLRTLIQHNLVSFLSQTGYDQPAYEIQGRNVYFLIRSQRMLAMIRNQFGKDAATIAEEIAARGQITLLKLLCICGRKRMESAAAKPSIEEIRKGLENDMRLFKLLVDNHVCCRTGDASFEPDQMVPYVQVVEALTYNVVEPDLTEVAIKISKGGDSSSNDADALVTWRLDMDNFYLVWRNKVSVDALIKRHGSSVDPKIFAILVEASYSVSLSKGLPTESPWVSTQKLVDKFSRTQGGKKMDPRKLEEYMEIIDMDPKSSILTDNPGTRVYCLDYTATLRNIICDIIENIIAQRHGSDARRIFRLVLTKSFVELDQIADVGMISSKVAKNLTYTLIHDNFVKLKEVRKTYNVTAATNKISFFLYVDINEVASSLLESSYHSIENAQIRRQFEKNTYRVVLAKEERVGKIHHTVKDRGATEDQLKDIEDLITPPEREMLNKAWCYSNALTNAMFHADDTIFILEEYFNCLKLKMKPNTGTKTK